MTKSGYYIMRELVVLSLNIYYIRTIIQKLDRVKASLLYVNLPTGSIDNTLFDLVKRRKSLQNRFKKILETDVVEKVNSITRELIIVILPETSGFTKNELEQGWTIIPDIYENNWIINIRTGEMYEATSDTVEFFQKNIAPLKSIYGYFNIDITNPLKGTDLRY